MSDEVKIFRPSLRRLADFFLTMNCFLLVVFAFRIFPSIAFEEWALFFNIVLFVFWFFVITPLGTVKLEKNVLTGRSPRFSKLSIPLRKVHHSKTGMVFRGFKRKLFKDIWSTEGERIRLHRKLLGETRVAEIMRAIEKYPFHAGTTSES